MLGESRKLLAEKLPPCLSLLDLYLASDPSLAPSLEQLLASLKVQYRLFFQFQFFQSNAACRTA